MLGHIIASPVTTLTGVATILGIVSNWIAQGGVNFEDFNQIWGILVGVGLIAAKDANK